MMLIKYFKGKWTFTRNIMCAETKKSFGNIKNGRAEFTGHEDDHEVARKLLYSEQGDLNLENSTSSLEVNRQYLYHFLGDLKADVFFFAPSSEEQHLKFFHHLQFEKNEEENQFVARADHPCVKDMYNVEMILRDDSFSMQWTVKGPRKNNIIVTNFVKS